MASPDTPTIAHTVRAGTARRHAAALMLAWLGRDDDACAQVLEAALDELDSEHALGLDDLVLAMAWLAEQMIGTSSSGASYGAAKPWLRQVAMSDG